jgi:uncharacterized protein YjlB
MTNATGILRAGRGTVEIATFRFEDGGAIPNNPDLPVICMRAVVSGTATASEIREMLEANGWGGTWQWTVFDYHHFHPNAHGPLAELWPA